MIWCPWASAVATMPNSAPDVPLVSSCTGLPTKPPGSTGETSTARFGICPVPMLTSPFVTIRSPSERSAALIGEMNGPPFATTRAEAAEGPLKVGAGVGGAATDLHCPSTTTPPAPMLETFAKATTLLELVSTIYKVSIEGSYVRPAGANTEPGVPLPQNPLAIGVNDV